MELPPAPARPKGLCPVDTHGERDYDLELRVQCPG